MERNQTELKKIFHQEMINLYKRTSKELKYKPPKLMDYINKYGGYEAAVKYITGDSQVQDFTILWENERLDLSVEALVTKAPYRELFLEDIVKYCDKKLADYSYAPKKVEEPEEEEEITPWEASMEDRPADRAIEEIIPVKAYTLYHEALPVTTEMWKEVLVKENIVTAKNLDLLLRIYLIGDEVMPSELSIEEGYTATYPYGEVVTALARRLKNQFKVVVPVSKENKILWWHLIFNGGYKDNTAFEWSLRPQLRRAINELLETHAISTEGIEVKTEKGYEEPEEEVILEKEETEIEAAKAAEEKPVAESPKMSDDSQILSPDLERLFAKLYGDTEESSEAVKQPEIKQEPVKLSEEKPVELIKAAPVSPVKIEAVKVDQASQAVEMKKSAAEPERENSVSSQEQVTEDKKAACLEYYGAVCDLCGFDYGYTYGETFEKLIEVHHMHNEDDCITEATDPIKDLIPICKNCHQVVHSKIPSYTLEEMRKMIKA